MLFNSLEFAIFLPIVFFLYWFVFQNRLRSQNLFLLVVSYVFYGWWDWKFLSLIAFSSLVDYSIGIALDKESKPSKRKGLLISSLIVNLGFLGFFKYYNFFVESFVDSFRLFGAELEASSLEIILPVGISFYTFQTLSYTIDVYKKRLEPTRDIVAFFAFVSFFPQLVAGPIERASNLLPQFYRKRNFNYAQAVDGSRQILWGLFKKIVIADNAAMLANQAFNNPEAHAAGGLWLGALFFTFQIYGDFSGYSDIAIGTSRLFGFNLLQNFAFPYFSRDIAEFWRRWHISLSTWFRDYVYIPLGGSRGGTYMKVKNTFIIFLVSGFWHGANWTFVFWGLLNAVYFIPLLLLKRNRKNTDTVAERNWYPSLREFGQMSFTFLLTVIAWVFFRAESLSAAFTYLTGMFSGNVFSAPNMMIGSYGYVLMAFILVEWSQRKKQHALQLYGVSIPKWLRWILYFILVLLILLFQGEQQEFIYFQF